jgi:outer membrane protein
MTFYFFVKTKSTNFRFVVFLVLFVSMTGGCLVWPDASLAGKAPIQSTTTTIGMDVLGAVKKTMELQPAILLQREQVNLARGAYRTSGGDFDWQVETAFIHQRDHSPIPNVDASIVTTQETSDFSLKFSKLLRTGVSVTPYVAYTGNRYQLLSGRNTDLSNTGSVGLLVKLPLLRGLGYENTAVEEIATSHALKASRLQLSYEISRSVYNTVQAFWTYLAAHKRLGILTEAEERARIILEKTKTMVQADELPAADMVNVQANLADKESSRLAVEQALVAARSELGMTMGIPPAEIILLPPPLGSFPGLDQAIMVRARKAEALSYVQIAALHRSDVLAAGEQNKSLQARTNAAKNQIKPALNLELALGYDGIESGSRLSRSLRTAEYHQDNPDWTAGIRLTYPLGNNRFEGLLEQASARYRQGLIEERELVRTLQADINVIRSDLFSLFDELSRSEDAVDNYSTAVDNERDKYQMGETTLLDLLYIEDRRDSAELNLLTVRQRVANNLAALRFKTGRLVQFVDDEGMVTLSSLTTLLLPEDAQ